MFGDGMKPTKVLGSFPVSFTAETSQAGVANVDILVEVCQFHFYHSLCGIKLSIISLA